MALDGSINLSEPQPEIGAYLHIFLVGFSLFMQPFYSVY